MEISKWNTCVFILTNATAHGTSSFTDVPSAPPCLEGAPCEATCLRERSKNEPPFAADVQEQDFLAPLQPHPHPPLQDRSLQLSKDPPWLHFTLVTSLKACLQTQSHPVVRRSIYTFGCYHRCCLVAKLCLTLRDPKDSSTHWIPRQEQSELSFPSPGDVPHPGTKPTSLAVLQCRQILYC